MRKKLKIVKFTIAFIFLFIGSSYGQEWVSLDTLPVPRADMTSVLIEDTLYVIGGNSPSGSAYSATDAVLRYDLINHVWLSPTPPLNRPRYGATAVNYDGSIFVFGGKENQDVYIPEIEMWNPGMDSWLDVGELALPRIGMRAFIKNDQIHLSGGISETLTRHSRIELATTHVLDDTTYVTIETTTDTLPTPRSYHVMGVVNDVAYLFGGYYLWPLNDAYSWTESGWNTLDPMPSSLADMAYTIFRVTEVPFFVLSGGRDEETESANVRYFHTVNNQWSDDFTLIDDLPIARYGHIMEAHDTDIFVMGGSYRNLVGERVILNDVLMFHHNPTPVEKERQEKLLPKELKLTASPNPSNGEVSINIESFSNESIDVKIFNLLGQPIKTWSINPQVGCQKLSWSGLNEIGVEVTGGVYFLSARQGNAQHVIKLLRLP